MTIRNIITEKSILLRDINNIGPGGASEELVILCSLLSSLNAEIADKQFILNQKKVEFLESVKTVSKAKMMAEASEEWREWFERMKQAEALEEMIRAIKYYLKSATKEYEEFTK